MRLRSRFAAASVLALAACTSAPAATDTASLAASPATAAAASTAAAGQQVYNTFCAACHNGGDETAPELAKLHTFSKDRVSTALQNTLRLDYGAASAFAVSDPPCPN